MHWHSIWPVDGCHDEDVGAEVRPDHLSEFDHLAEDRATVEVWAREGPHDLREQCQKGRQEVGERQVQDEVIHSGKGQKDLICCCVIYQFFLCENWAIPGLFLFYFRLLMQLVHIYYNNCRWSESNRGPLESEATALPTESQCLPPDLSTLHWPCWGHATIPTCSKCAYNFQFIDFKYSFLGSVTSQVQIPPRPLVRKINIVTKAVWPDGQIIF